MLLRFTNLSLLALAAVLTLTGVYGLIWTLAGWPFELHRWAGWTLLALVPWKAAISWRSLRRGPGHDFDRSLGMLLSLLLAAVGVAVVASGILWTWRIGPQAFTLLGWRDTAMSWHWMLGLGMALPLAVHAWRLWPRFRASDFSSRRGALRTLGIGLGGAAAWWAGEGVARARVLPTSPRRVTGSREQGSFAGNDFPVTAAASDGREPVALDSWRLEIGGQVRAALALSYEDLLRLPSAGQVVTLDCTVGWYTAQLWSGPPLQALLELAGADLLAQAVRLGSLEGYRQLLPMDEARQALLATHVGGQPLEHRHGFPLRAVVPGRRGWFWVKWLTRIEVLA
jgi:hypothetical protein